MVGALSRSRSCGFIAFVPDKALVYLVLGAHAVRGRGAAGIVAAEHRVARRAATASGFITTAMQLMAGIGGLFLDVFFQKSKLDRKTTVATKAMAQTVQPHRVAMLYFVPLGGIGERDAALGAIVPAHRCSRSPARRSPPLMLERMTDHGFRQWTRDVIFAVSASICCAPAWLFWQG